MCLIKSQDFSVKGKGSDLLLHGFGLEKLQDSWRVAVLLGAIIMASESYPQKRLA
jgi:hypothetical protein